MKDLFLQKKIHTLDRRLRRDRRMCSNLLMALSSPLSLAALVGICVFEPNHAAGVKLIFLILTVASARILFYYVTAALKMSKRKPYG